MAIPATEPPALQFEDIRPSVSVPQSRFLLWLGIAALMIVALFLFNALEARRKKANVPSISESRIDRSVAPASVPDLYVPQAFAEPAQDGHIQPDIKPPVDAYRLDPPTRTPSSPSPARTADRPAPAALRPPVSDDGISPNVRPSKAGADAKRDMTGRFANPSTTIPQGALIGAVLETALDSTRGGPTRALVTRDVRGFDGTQILVPRGSRLIGEYAADLSPGQNRALILWTRIIRPDGVTIALNSPAADTLGRIGVKGSVNSHLLERLTNAVLSSAINLGMNAATRDASRSTVVVALPSNANGQEVAEALTGNMQIRPTLKIKQGTRVTIFVARDLNFSSADQP